MIGGMVASRLCASVCRGPLPCWAAGPVGGLNGLPCVGVDGPVDMLPRGPVGIVVGVGGPGDRPGREDEGAHPPRGRLE